METQPTQPPPLPPLTAQHALYAAVYEHLARKRQRLWPMDGAAALRLAAADVELAPPPPLQLPPPAPPLEIVPAAACEPDRIVWNKRTRQPKKAAMTPITDHGRVQIVPCDPQKATFTVARSAGGLRLFVAASVYGAALHGWGAEALAILQSVAPSQDPGGHLRARRLLHGMLHAGVPVLLCLGANSYAKAVEHYEHMFNMVDAGSPMLVCDDRTNLLMLATPMGRLVYVPEGQQGLVPRELLDMRGANAAGSRSCLELWVRPVCVTEHTTFALRQWFRNAEFAYAAAFRWAVDDMHRGDPAYLQLAGQPASKILPNSSPINTLFKKTVLASLGSYLGDFVGKLQQCDGVPKQAAAEKKRAGRWPEALRKQKEEEQLNNPTLMFQSWRRAVLLKAVLDLADVHGHAHRLLGALLPTGLLSPGRQAAVPPAPIPEPAAFETSAMDAAAAGAFVPAVLQLALTL